MDQRQSTACAVSVLGVAALLTGCTSDKDDPDATTSELSQYETAIDVMQSWSEFCDKASPHTIVEHLGSTHMEISADTFDGENATDGVASGKCGGTFETVPGNSGAFQVALHAYASDAEAQESLDEWRASTTGQSLTPEFEVGTADSDIWITQSGGTASDVDGSALHGFYWITFTIRYPVYDDSDDCGSDGAPCTPAPQETLAWLEDDYLPGLIEAVASRLPQD